ncbi:hypothetical protein [Ancylobacter sp. SL191]|uniref:hypothetical protein n=1 Tax=Ancylobacter sp. SL191 TaxID=2995166 RepID=UPI00226F9511|nr:hypothetical protein [Ancylobacter sp. SL191]WAC28057.1 hypothetical protein OU996_03040 [Ancylobacter sp. SL191]
MANLEHWAKADALNIYQIALLLEEIDPAPLERLGYQCLSERTRDQTSVHVVNLKNAVLTDKLRPVLRSYDSFGDHDWTLTLIGTPELKVWLWTRDLHGTVFGASAKTKPLLSAFSRFYAQKLDAAVAAWQAVTSEPHRLRGRSPKQALEGWLTENAKEYGLLNRDGTPNRTGIEEIAKVANWNQKGGAPSTPTLPAEPTPSFGGTFGKVLASPPLVSGNLGDDDDIPF